MSDSNAMSSTLLPVPMDFDWQRPTNQGIMALPDRFSVESEALQMCGKWCVYRYSLDRVRIVFGSDGSN